MENLFVPIIVNDSVNVTRNSLFCVSCKKFDNRDKSKFNGVDERILNKEKNTWHHPKDENETYNYSYDELYNISLRICVKLNKIAYEVLHNNRNIDDLINNIKLINLKSIQELLG